MSEKYDYLGHYIFSVGEVVTVGGNPNVLAEVIDTSDYQLKVRILTQPNKGKTLYTTRYTYYTTPMPHLTPQEVTNKVEKILAKSKRERKMENKTYEDTKTLENTSFEEKVEDEPKETIKEITETISKVSAEESEFKMEQMSLF